MVALAQVRITSAIPWCHARADRGRRSERLLRGGSLAVPGGAALAGAINAYLAGGAEYRHVVATQDFHIDPGDHFSDHPDYISSWPPHCRAGTAGGQFRPRLPTRTGWR